MHKQASKFHLFSFFIILFGFFVNISSEAQAVSKEYQLKAAFLYKFLNFIDRDPSLVWEEFSEPKVICIFGENPFEGALDEIIKVFDPDQRKTTSKIIMQIEDATSCHAIFISKSQSRYVNSILYTTVGHPILTVSDIDGFAHEGGVIQLLLDGSRVRFVINQESAKQKGLVISSQLLALAKEVITRP